MQEGITGAKNAADAKHKFTIKRQKRRICVILKIDECCTLVSLNQWAQGSSLWRCTNKIALNRKIWRSLLLCNPEKSGSARSMHGFCTVDFFVGILCMGWNCFEMRGKFCIRSAEPDGAAPLLRGLHFSAVPAEQSWRWSVRLRRVQPAGWGFPV